MGEWEEWGGMGWYRNLLGCQHANLIQGVLLARVHQTHCIALANGTVHYPEKYYHPLPRQHDHTQLLGKAHIMVARP